MARHKPSPFNAPTHSVNHRLFDQLSNALFLPTAKLDTSQVDDRRNDVLSPELVRMLITHYKGRFDEFHTGDSRVERPAPNRDPRPAAAGATNTNRHAMAGDGRDERPAPAPEREGPRQLAKAGSGARQKPHPKKGRSTMDILAAKMKAKNR